MFPTRGAGSAGARRRALIPATAGLLALIAVPARAAQPPDSSRVVSARLSVIAVDGSDAVDVRITYGVAGSAGEAPVDFRMLAFGSAEVPEFRVEGIAGTVVLEPAQGRAWTAQLPAGVLRDTVVVTYRVEGAVEASGSRVRLRVPVVFLDLVPAQGEGAVFTAEVRVPRGWSVTGGFPSGLAQDADGAWRTRLAVVPAVVSLRGRSDGRWRPGLPLVLELLALATLGAFGVVGARHLRAVVTRAEAAS